MGYLNVCQLILLGSALLLCHTPPMAEGATEDKEFYVAFFGTNGRPTYYLYVTTPEVQPVSFTITAPGTGYSMNGTAQYGEVAAFAFSASEYELMSSSDRGKAIIVKTETDGELIVYSGNLRSSTSDSFLSLPKQRDKGRLTYKFFAVSYISKFLTVQSYVVIIAQYNNTLLSITPTVDTMIDTTFTTAGTTTNVTLQEAETFLITNTNDLTGLTVVSNKPLALSSGHECTQVPSSEGSCDLLVEQIPPVSSWGRQFATAPLKGRQAFDVFRVLASSDSTTVVVNCTSNTVTDTETVITETYQLDEGRFEEFNVPSDQYCFIQGSAIILVVQYSVGYTADGVTGDPTMIIVPAITQYSNQYSLPTIQPSDGSFTFTHYMNIFIPAQFNQLDQVFLNNQSLSSYNVTFTAIEHNGIPQVYAAQVNLTDLEGVHTLHHTDPAASLGVIMYGFGEFVSYGHPGGLQTQGFCLAETGPNGHLWPDTPVGKTATQPCQCEASELIRASRSCGSDGQWGSSDATPCEISLVVGTLCTDSPVVSVNSAQPATLVVTLPVVGGVVLLILLAAGGAYLIWRLRQKGQPELKMGEL